LSVNSHPSVVAGRLHIYTVKSFTLSPIYIRVSQSGGLYL